MEIYAPPPLPRRFVSSVVPRGMEGGTGCFHLGRKPHVPRMLHAAPLHQDRLRDGQFYADGGSEHPAPVVTSRLAYGREFWTGEITFPLPSTLLSRHAVTLDNRIVRGIIALTPRGKNTRVRFIVLEKKNDRKDRGVVHWCRALHLPLCCCVYEVVLLLTRPPC